MNTGFIVAVAIFFMLRDTLARVETNKGSGVEAKRRVTRSGICTRIRPTRHPVQRYELLVSPWTMRIGAERIELSHSESKSDVLPLDDAPIKTPTTFG